MNVVVLHGNKMSKKARIKRERRDRQLWDLMSVHLTDEGLLSLNLPSDGPGGIITVRAPRAYTLDGAPAGVKMSTTDRDCKIEIPAGTQTIKLK